MFPEVYNALGQRKESYDFKSNQEAVPYASKKTYDKVGRLIKEEAPFEKSGSTIQYSVKEYLYSPLGQVIEERTSINKPNEAIVMQSQRYTYDDMNRLVMVRLENPGKTPVITQYYYDAVGNQVRMYTGLSSP